MYVSSNGQSVVIPECFYRESNDFCRKETGFGNNHTEFLNNTCGHIKPNKKDFIKKYFTPVTISKELSKPTIIQKKELL